jgi:glycosyltransferase involved in cell wall biosynthesis
MIYSRAASVRILHLADRLSDRGGAYRCLLGWLEALAPGHEQALAVGADDGTAAARYPVHVEPALGARARLAGSWDVLRERFRPDVVHLHNVTNPDALEWAADRGAVLTVQDHRFFCATQGKWTSDGRVCRDPMERSLCRSCFDDEAYFAEVYGLTEERLAAARRLRLVVLSRYMRKELAASGVPEGRIAVVPPFPHGLDLEAAPDGPPCVLFVGRLAAAKGVRDAVLAWQAARIDLPLVFAGTGPLRSWLEGAGFPVLGWLDRRRLSSACRRARALLMPSRWQEPFGIAGLEALALGVPVVTWESGGIAEWHPGDFLVPWGDLGGLAHALRRAVDAPIQPRPSLPPGFDAPTAAARLEALYAEAALPVS